MKKLYIIIMAAFTLLGGTAAYTCHENNITITYQVQNEQNLMADFSEALAVTRR